MTRKAEKLLEFLAGVLSGRPILTRKDLARHYGRSLRTIDRWKEAGDLPRPVYLHGPMWRPVDLANLEREERR